MDAINKNDVALWIERMGFNGKQLSKAGDLLGVSERAWARRRSGELELTLTDRLAMAAVRAGLPPWSPETDKELSDVARLREVIAEISGRGGA